jgi:chemotaxis signal transduction protein
MASDVGSDSSAAGNAGVAGVTSGHGGGDAVRVSVGDCLAFTVEGVACAVPLTDVHEVLPAIPTAVPLPDSPPWLLGIFPWRSNLLGLIDPAPVLTGKPRATRPPWRTAGAPGITPTATAGRVAGPFPGGSAVVLGDEAVSIALAVDTLGELLHLPDQRLLPPAGSAPVLARYCAGVGAPEAHGPRYAVLAVRPLLRDVVVALTEDGWEDGHE